MNEKAEEYRIKQVQEKKEKPDAKWMSPTKRLIYLKQKNLQEQKNEQMRKTMPIWYSMHENYQTEQYQEILSENEEAPVTVRKRSADDDLPKEVTRIDVIVSPWEEPEVEEEP